MSEKCDMLQSLIDRIAAGETIEAGVEEMAAIGSGLLRINAKIRQTIAVLICDAKRFLVISNYRQVPMTFYQE